MYIYIAISLNDDDKSSVIFTLRITSRILQIRHSKQDEQFQKDPNIVNYSNNACSLLLI